MVKNTGKTVSRGERSLNYTVVRHLTTYKCMPPTHLDRVNMKGKVAAQRRFIISQQHGTGMAMNSFRFMLICVALGVRVPAGLQ